MWGSEKEGHVEGSGREGHVEVVGGRDMWR